MDNILITFLKWLFTLFAKATPPTKPPVTPPAPAPGGPLSGELIARIVKLAGPSPLAMFSWGGRGRAPIGYTKGMAVAFAVVYRKWKAGDGAARVMASAVHETDANDEIDALSWYNSNFRAAGMSNDVAGADTLRHLFVLLIGLGMRESSGRYCEGRDEKAGNTSADEAEAGLFQTSWDIRSASPELPKLFAAYKARPDGFLSIFKEGTGNPAAADMRTYGSGDGATFQALSKNCPLFAVETAAVGLRTDGGNKGHWGPIRRKEAELRPEADRLLREVQALVDGTAVPVAPVAPGVVAGGKPPWVMEALKDVGFHETGENRGIEKFIADAHAGSLGDPWCAIAACAWFERVGIRSPRSASSQSFRRDPGYVKLAGPAYGAVAVYWRGMKPDPIEDATTGHVGFYLGETASQVLTLGGNESDAVRKQFEPKARLIGYWWPKSIALPKIAAITVKDADGAPVGSVT